MLKALSNKRRLQILCSLLEGECCVNELEKTIRISQSALSQHLAKLRQADLVGTRRNAQTIYYSLKDEAVYTMLSVIRDTYRTRTALEEKNPDRPRKNLSSMANE